MTSHFLKGTAIRRYTGITLLVVSVITGIVLLVTGNLYSSRVLHEESGGTPSGYWQVTAVEFNLNWLCAVPLAVGFAIGLLCTLLPQRRQHGT